jgi:hypothetical protein
MKVLMKKLCKEKHFALINTMPSFYKPFLSARTHSRTGAVYANAFACTEKRE